MTSSEPGDRRAGPTADELRSRGWERRFVYDEPRLSEAVEIYRELGFEVLLLPIAPDDSECTECMLQEPDRFKVIYTRKRRFQPPAAG